MERVLLSMIHTRALSQAAEIAKIKRKDVAAVNAHQHAVQQTLVIGEQGRRCGICLTCTQQRKVEPCMNDAGPRLRRGRSQQHLLAAYLARFLTPSSTY